MDKQKSLKQYFTPYKVAEFMVANSPVPANVKIIDPAVGDGIFVEVLLQKGFDDIQGIDIDQQVIQSDRWRYNGYNNVVFHHGDALDSTALGVRDGYFDLAIGNPPFSNQKSKIKDVTILNHFYLRKQKQSVEILFLERFFQLVKDGGLIRLILPINIFSNTNLQYVRNFIIHNSQIEAIVSLPRNIFKNTSAKTAILFARKSRQNQLGGLADDSRRKVKLLQVQNRTDLKRLETLSIYEQFSGLWKNLDEIQYRMDPDYHFAEAKHKTFVANSQFGFAKLSEIVQVYNGFTKYGEDRSKVYTSVKRDKKKCVRLIKAKNIHPFGFRFYPHSFFIRKDEDIYKPQACIRKGDVLIVRVGAGCAGRAVWVMGKKYQGQVDDWIFILRNSKLNPAYLSFYLNSSIGKDFIGKEKQGTGTISISKNKLGNVLIPVLPKNIQGVFEKSVLKMYKLFEKGDLYKAKEIYQDLDLKLRSCITKKEGTLRHSILSISSVASGQI